MKPATNSSENDSSKNKHLLLDWEEQTLQTVGKVIAFWGFKENHGKIWALLSLREEGLTALELRELLGLSKGGVSMLLQDLESWNVIIRQEAEEIDEGVFLSLTPEEKHSVEKRRGRIYKASSDFYQMISYVLQRREQDLLTETLSHLNDAASAAESTATQHQKDVLETMISSAALVQRSLQFFCNNASSLKTILDLYQTLDLSSQENSSKEGF